MTTYIGIRQIEMLNLFMGFEVGNRYALSLSQYSHAEPTSKLTRLICQTTKTGMSLDISRKRNVGSWGRLLGSSSGHIGRSGV